MNLNGRLLSMLPALAHSIGNYSLSTSAPRRSLQQPGSRIVHEAIVGTMYPGQPDGDDDPIGSYTDTLSMRQRIRAYAADESIGCVFIWINSGGGLVEGTLELAEEVRRLKAVKRVEVIGEGYVCSGAYWVASQASSIALSPSCLCGSIGVRLVVIDTSTAVEQLGIRVVPITTGINKLAGLPGHPVLDEHVRMLQNVVDIEQLHFQIAIMKGRELNQAQVDRVSDGSIWNATQAKSLGLCDFVMLPDDRLNQIENAFAPEPYAGLSGSAALEQYLALANDGRGEDEQVDDLEDVLPSIAARLSKQFPTLSTQAHEYERNRPPARHYTRRR
jgi:signal peptide peptidase SppA